MLYISVSDVFEYVFRLRVFFLLGKIGLFKFDDFSLWLVLGLDCKGFSFIMVDFVILR